MMLTTADMPSTDLIQTASTLPTCQVTHKWEVKFGEWVCDRCRSRSGVKFGEPKPDDKVLNQQTLNRKEV